MTTPSSPAARRATPASIDRDHPGGDADSPIDAALERLLSEPLGTHVDYWHTLKVVMPDRPLWRGTKFKRYKTRAAYYYGEDRVALSVLSYAPAESSGTPAACLRPLLHEARRTAKKLDIALGPMRREVRTYRRGPESVDWASSSTAVDEGERTAGGGSGGSKAARARRVAELRASQPHADVPMPRRTDEGELVVVRTSADIRLLFERRQYTAAFAAYESWPGTCLVQLFAARVGTDPELAERVVTRWVDEAAPKLRWASWLRQAPPFENR